METDDIYKMEEDVEKKIALKSRIVVRTNLLFPNSNDGRTQTAETTAWDSKILIAFPGREFQEFQTHLFSKHRSKNDQVLVL